jgi:membrane fusion protein (multidrug efflux system)
VTLTSAGAQVVDKVRFRSGDHVKQGQVLLELRRDAEDAAIAQAQAQVELAKSTADRWNKLAAQGLAPAATAEQYQSAYITAQTTLDTAKARLKDRVISAPFSGTVGLSDIAPGALISPGTAIATLDDTTVITVDIDVPDRNLSLVKEGTAIDATSDAYPGEHYSGKIAKIDTRIDERSRSFKVRAELPNPGDRLKPGMLLHVGIDRGTHSGLAIPEAAIQYSAGQASVFMFLPRNGGAGAGRPGAQGQAGQAPANGQRQGQGAAPGAAPGGQGGPGGAGRPGGGRGGGIPGTAVQRPVIAGIDECGFVEVKDGLELGDRIIADGLNKLSPNQTVLATFGGGRGPGGQSGAAGRGGPAAGGAPGQAAAANGGQPGGRRGDGAGPRGEGRGAGAPGATADRAGPGGARGPGMGRGGQMGGRGGTAGKVKPASADRCAAPARGGAGAMPVGGRGPGAPDGQGRRGRGGPDAAPAPGGAPGAGRGRRGVETVQ